MSLRLIPTPRSVRGTILLAFGSLIVITLMIVTGAVITVREYQSATSEMQKRANLASELQTGQANGSVAALLLQRYVVSGDESLVTEIQLSAGAAVQSLERGTLLAQQTDTEASDTYEVLQNISATSRDLVAGAQGVIEMRQAGQTEEAAAAIEEIVPTFRRFRLQLIDQASFELAEVDHLQSEADQAGDLALGLLVVSGILGSALAIAVAVAVSKSIIGPLSRLEETALAVALGDMKARAPVAGPRELKRLAESLNLMTSTAHKRTEELRLSNEELRQRNRQLLDARFQASTDPLTGLLNHRTFHDKIKSVATTALREGGVASLIMIDIDNFKRVNDSLGHMAGDHVLREISAVICEVAGDQHAYRYGGDEFAILLPNVGRSEAFNIADRILKTVKTRVKSEDGGKATISLGVACFPDMAASSEELLYRADMALNYAKSRGKNRVGGWDQVESQGTFVLQHIPAVSSLD
jgi:diguanylate cyclase (GGDEF)-like protein